MGFGGSGGSGASIAASSDVALSNPVDQNVLSFDGTSAKWKNTTVSVGQVVVRWNAGSSTWGTRPAGAQFGVLFLSTNDPNAPAPSDAGLMTGDVWRRHPDAV